MSDPEPLPAAVAALRNARPLPPPGRVQVACYAHGGYPIVATDAVAWVNRAMQQPGAAPLPASNDYFPTIYLRIGHYVKEWDPRLYCVTRRDEQARWEYVVASQQRKVWFDEGAPELKVADAPPECHIEEGEYEHRLRDLLDGEGVKYGPYRTVLTLLAQV